ncbi:MAG: hypothetical protein P3X22_001270 [Thermoprotei archaeon]|nr:hypothetical protein [Thermoprotei archaeon]
MSEIPVKLSYIPLVVWIVVIVLLAGFVFTTAFIQLNVKFSDEELTEKKQNKISEEVFGNLPAFIVLVVLILGLALIGFYKFVVGRSEATVSSAPGELV